MSGTVLAQDQETFTLETDQGILTIDHPAGWLIGNTDQSPLPYAFISNQALVNTTLPSALIELAVVPLTALPIEFDYNADNVALAYFQAFQESRTGFGIYSEILAVEFGNFDGAMMTFMEDDPTAPLSNRQKISLGLAVHIDAQTLLIMDFQAIAILAEQMMPTWQMMLESVTWNGASLVDQAVLTAFQNLEQPRHLRDRFLIAFEDQPDVPTADMNTRYEIETGTIIISFLRPFGWIATENDKGIVLHNPTIDEATIAIRWWPDIMPTNDALTIIDTHTFTWNDHDAVGYTYQSDTTVGARFGITLSEGMLEVGLDCQPADWQTVQLNLLVALSGLTVDGENLTLSDLVQSFNSLQKPIS